MAKNDNLTDFLTDVADAIRAKKGTMGPINPQNFSAEIAAIETGKPINNQTKSVSIKKNGRTDVVADEQYTGLDKVVVYVDVEDEENAKVSVPTKAVNFRDYNGAILYSYNKADFLALTELPVLPSQHGLICQGWNYNLEDAQNYVRKYGILEIGATYVTDDGKTRLYISVLKGRQDIPLYISQTVANGVVIDWGDGSATETISGTGYKNTTHSYADEGDYVITLEVVNGCVLNLGYGSSSYCVLGSTNNSGKVYCNSLKKVEFGEGITRIENYTFQYCHSLSSITLPQGVTRIGSYAFHTCYSLSSITLPQGVTSIDSYAFSSCNSLFSITIPQGVTSINSYAFSYCGVLSSVAIPQSVTSIGTNAFQYCYSLTLLVIPQSVTSIGTNAFQYCHSLSSITIPQGVTSIGSYMFRSCNSLFSITLPQGVTSIGAYAFEFCYPLSSITLPQGVTSIGVDAFYSCYSLVSIVFPQSLTSIKATAFYDCYGMALYDFRALTSVPTLANSNAFSGIQSSCKIVVPDVLYDEWIAATNWSSYKSRIVKASEFNG